MYINLWLSSKVLYYGTLCIDTPRTRANGNSTHALHSHCKSLTLSTFAGSSIIGGDCRICGVSMQAGASSENNLMEAYLKTQTELKRPD